MALQGIWKLKVPEEFTRVVMRANSPVDSRGYVARHNWQRITVLFFTR